MAARKPEPIEQPPSHLQPATAAWWASVLAEYALEQHHIRLLTLAATAWDRAEDARQAIEAHGLTFIDRQGSPRTRPEIAVERDSRIAFTRMLRELDLDVSEPSATPRPPALRSNRRA